MVFTFKLATNAYAKSGQLLVAELRSGGVGETPCKMDAVNVPTVRGNLTIVNSPQIQTGTYGQIITWTVTLKNTGLGTVYDALASGNIGSGYDSRQVSPPQTPITLLAGEDQDYIVTATIESCTNLTHTAEAYWSIGNKNGTATSANPIGEEADVVLDLEDPEVSVEVGPIPSVNYCGALDAQVPVTVTNSGGPAEDLVLASAVQGLNVALPPGEWLPQGSKFVYLPTSLDAGETITFSAHVTTADLCAPGSVSLGFTPEYVDACKLMDLEGAPDTTVEPNPLDAPTLNVTKGGGGPIVAGETFVYNVNVSGENYQSITGGLAITDIVPADLIIDSFAASAGSVSQAGNTLSWAIAPGQPAPTARTWRLRRRCPIVVFPHAGPAARSSIR